MRLLMIAGTAVFLTAASCKPRVIKQDEGLGALVGDSAGPGAGELAPPEVIQAMVEDFQRVHFAYDSASLDAPSRAALSRNAELMRRWGGLEVEIQGHADARGSTEYNLALGYRRAAAVRDFLVAGGVSPERVALVSYGEEIPLDRSRGELALAANRRAEFRVISGEGARGTVE